MSLSRRLAGLPPLLRFALVGVVGFAVDGGLLQGLTLAGWGPLEARLVSFPAAVLCTWWLNRAITFRGSDHGPLLASLLRYIGVSVVGTGVNFAVYAGLVLGSATMAATPVVPFAIASVAALAFNYLGSKHFAFRRAGS